MWEKLNFFGWNKKKEVQPVQREVSITMSNGDRQEVIQRSPSGTKLGSSSVKHGLDDDDSSEGSTSLNFGVKANASPRRNSSYSFSREPLDLPTWSNVTSPGFTSRLVQQASGHSPLKEFNDSLSFSPFRNSPHAHLQLGELPHVSFTRKPKLSPPIFPSPQKSLRSGASSSVYSRDRRRNARQGTVFVRIAPIDPSTKANISLSGKTPSPNIASVNNGSPYPPRGSPRSVEPYRPEGLGGIPSQELAMRFNRMWSPPPGSAMQSLQGRPSSPTSPSNIVEALTAGRKRVREQDTYYGLPTPGPSSASSPPSKISVGIGDTPARPQMSKRVKFLGAPESQDRPMMVSYSGMGGGDSEPLSSESILEQMNQTEKRFLPDSTSTPYSISKKSRLSSAANIEEQSSTLQSALRKRRNQSNIISANDEDTRGEKLGRFCRCNECYAEAAGVSSFIQPQTSQRSGSLSAGGSPNKSDDASTSPGKSNNRQTCDRGVSTEPDKVAFFREIYRKPDKKPVEKVDEIMKRPPVVLTKEMYDKDKQKRIERYYRILSMKPPNGSIFDVTEDAVAKPASDINGEASKTASTSAPCTTTNNVGGFGFGLSAPPTTDGFTFNKQASPTPTAITNTTSVCSTITSPSSTGNTFGSNSASVTAPSNFGSPLTSATSSGLPGVFGTTAPTSLAPVSTGSISFGTAPPSTNPGVFAFGKQTPSDATDSTNPSNVGSTNNNSTPLLSGTITASTTGTGVVSSSTAPPSYGQSVATGASGGLTFGATVPISATGASTTGTGGISFGTPSSSTTTPSTGFSFGKQTTQNIPVPNTNAANVGSSISSLPASTTGNVASSPFGQALAPASSGGFGSPISTNNDKTSGSGSSSGGFNFSGGSNPNSLANTTTSATAATTSTFGILGGPAIASTASSTTVPTFGLMSSTSTSQPPPFGSGNNNNNAGFSFGSNTMSPPQSQPSSGGFSFGGTAQQQQSAPAPASSSSFGGFAFGGQSNTPASLPPAPTAAPSPAGVFQFGQPAGNTTTGAAASSPFQYSASVTAPSSFGSPLTSATPSGLPGVFGTSNVGSNNNSTSLSSGTITASTTVTGGVSASPSFGQSVATGASGGLTFGATVPISATGASTTGTGGISFGTPSSSTFGFSFGKQTTQNTPVPNTNAANVGSSISSLPASTTGNVASSPFGQALASASSGGFGSPISTNNDKTSGSGSSSGGFNFSGGSNPNSLANTTTSATAATTSTFGTFGGPAITSTASSTSVPTFGLMSSTANSQPPPFGSGNNNNNAGFSFGSNTMSPPQSQPSSGGFSFGGTAQQQQSAPAPASSSSFGGFAFGGQSNTPASLPPAPTAAPSPAGVFQFGQPAGNTTTGAAASSPFQFGQQAQQGVPGGFNFSAAAPAGVANQMFSVGATNTAPRRRDPRRRHR